MNKIQKLLEYQLNTSINTIQNDYNISHNNLSNLINNVIISKSINITIKKNININDSNDSIIQKRLYDLLDNVPDFIHMNKTLEMMTKNFILICKKDKINSSSISEDLINSLLIQYIENSI